MTDSKCPQVEIAELRAALEACHQHSSMLENRCDFWNDAFGEKLKAKLKLVDDILAVEWDDDECINYAHWIEELVDGYKQKEKKI